MLFGPLTSIVVDDDADVESAPNSAYGERKLLDLVESAP